MPTPKIVTELAKAAAVAVIMVIAKIAKEAIEKKA